MNKTERNRKLIITLTQTGMLAAIMVILTFTPIGFVYVGVIKITFLHIPVIIGSVLLGPKIGAVLGGIFGLLSILSNTLLPIASSFLFSPFVASAGGVYGGWKSLVIALVPRILVGIVPYFVYIGCKKLFQKSKLSGIYSSILAGICGTLTNTIFVLGLASLLLTAEYAAVRNVAIEGLFYVILTTVGTNGILEAVTAAIVVTAVLKIKPLAKLNGRTL